jgi:hypothetical protein
MILPARTRRRTNPNPGQLQIQADKEALAADRKARAQKRDAEKQAERDTRVERLSGMEHQLLAEDLAEKTPHAPKAKRPAKAKVARGTVEDFRTEEPPTPAPSKVVNLNDVMNGKTKNAQVTLRQSVNKRLNPKRSLRSTTREW